MKSPLPHRKIEKQYSFMTAETVGRNGVFARSFAFRHHPQSRKRLLVEVVERLGTRLLLRIPLQAKCHQDPKLARVK